MTAKITIQACAVIAEDIRFNQVARVVAGFAKLAVTLVKGLSIAALIAWSIKRRWIAKKGHSALNTPKSSEKHQTQQRPARDSAAYSPAAHAVVQ